MKTAELTGAALDWAVAKCKSKLPRSYDDWKQKWPHYSTNWSQGGPIIERELIDIVACRDIEQWEATTLGYEVDKDGFQPEHVQRGPTPLIAAMRCYVTSKLGDEVEIPEELTCQSS